MTNKEAIKRIKWEFDNDIFIRTPHRQELFDALTMAIQALSQEPCDDAISRKAVLKLKHHKPEYGDMIYAFDVEQLPSVTQKSGKWNEYYTSQKGNDVFNCKECGHTFVVTQGKDNMNYCPNCGAKMEGEK